jgi:hypothetical protein
MKEFNVSENFQNGTKILIHPAAPPPPETVETGI